MTRFWMGPTRRYRISTPWPRSRYSISAKVISHGRFVTFQMAEVAVPKQIFREILSLIVRLRAPPAPACPADRGHMRQTATAEVCLDEGKATNSGTARRATDDLALNRGSCDRISLRRASMRRKITLNNPGFWGMSAENRAGPQGITRHICGLPALTHTSLAHLQTDTTELTTWMDGAASLRRSGNQAGRGVVDGLCWIESVKVSLQTPVGVSRRPIFSTVVR
jgi:hypothetical protein